MEDILLVHRKSNRNFIGLPAQAAVWQTCLRSILFCSEADFDFCSQSLESEDQVLRGQDALTFLLEVLCGLHSPILGETEVFGQFKSFMEKRREAKDLLFADSQKWLSFTLAEVKRTRAEHLTGLGSQSYGSLLRKYCKDAQDVAILGSGQLAQEILPWLAHKKNLHLVCRSPEKIEKFAEKFNNLSLKTYKQVVTTCDTLIIAAPLSDELILNLLDSMPCPPASIFDLRGEENNLALGASQRAPQTQVLGLQQFFSEIEETKKETSVKLLALKMYLQEKALAFMQRTELHPLGWDDICA
ncbi:MAG: NAD(P)-binding domain-containing protein [Bdellovibrio sp.]|nr:NAD(P)-binding domain-containing protein [Bdellovibrio sp.]